MKVAVIGAGTMGGGIAISAMFNGFDVFLVDPSSEMLDRAVERSRKYVDRQVAKGRMQRADGDAILARLQVSGDLDGAALADLVIEAVFEDLEVKQTVFTRLERVVADSCYFATNTSALKITDIACVLTNPSRLCGLHYFSPAEVNPVVEVVKGDQTDGDTIAAVLEFARHCGKTAIECKDQSGFALNRFFCPYANEAARCLDAGLGTPAQIDDVAREALGVSLGPFAVMNIVKPRIMLAAVRNLSHLGEFYLPAESLIAVGEADASWDIGGDTPDLADKTRYLIAKQLMTAIFHAVREELAEGVARPEDIDIGAKMAFGFEKGPVELMNEVMSNRAYLSNRRYKTDVDYLPRRPV